MERALPACKPANALFLADRPQRLDALELRTFEAEIRREWSEESLGPVLEAIAARRAELEHIATIEVPTCAYCSGRCDQPNGWFAVERWEAGRVRKRGYACSAGCLIATAHSQVDRNPSGVPVIKGALTEIEDE